MEQEAERFRAKYISIGRNIGRKEEREARQAEVDRAEKRGVKKGRKIERKRLSRQRGRKKWYWKHRVFSVETVFAIAFSVVALKAIDILPKLLAQ